MQKKAPPEIYRALFYDLVVKILLSSESNKVQDNLKGLRFPSASVPCVP